MSLLEKIKKGNMSSGVAALENIFLAGIKAVAASISGSGTMFALAMHSLADSINQGSLNCPRQSGSPPVSAGSSTFFV